MYAMDSLRLEKGYPAWKVDLSHEYTPLEAALERFVDLDKPDFIGREALLRQRAAGVRQRLVPLLVETDVEAPFCASVVPGGERVGLVGSAGYGHTLQQSIALAYVRSDLAARGHARSRSASSASAARRRSPASRPTIRRTCACAARALGA